MGGVKAKSEKPVYRPASKIMDPSLESKSKRAVQRQYRYAMPVAFGGQFLFAGEERWLVAGEWWMGKSGVTGLGFGV